MKRGFLTLVVLAVSAASSVVTAATTFVSDAFGYVASSVSAAYRVVKKLVADGFKLMERADSARVAERPLVQAKAFVQRLAKRERPTVTPGWRMCPSI